jgi:hypothetical protein
MSRIRVALALAIATIGLAFPAAMAAAGPDRSSGSFTYTLADALADYAAFGENAGDCGDFVLLIDYTVERDVTLFADREVRHVHYDGHFYSSADTSRSIGRGGDFNITFRLDASGLPYGVTRTGVTEYAIIDGAKVVTHAGRDVIDFATGPISETPKAGGDVVQAVCDALS